MVHQHDAYHHRISLFMFHRPMSVAIIPFCPIWGLLTSKACSPYRHVAELSLTQEPFEMGRARTHSILPPINRFTWLIYPVLIYAKIVDQLHKNTHNLNLVARQEHHAVTSNPL